MRNSRPAATTIFTVWFGRILAVLFWLLPLLATPWSFEQFRLPRGLFYLFCVWALVLLGGAGVLARERMLRVNGWNLWIPILAAATCISWASSSLAYMGLQTVASILLSLATIWLLSTRLTLSLLNLCLWGVVAGGWINSLFGILQFFGKDPVFINADGSTYIYGRHFVGGLFGNPNLLGIYLAQAIICAAALTIWNWRRRRLRCIALLSLLIFGIATLLALALAAVLALTAAAAVGAIILLRPLGISWRRAAAVGGVLIIALLLVISALLGLDIYNRERVLNVYRGVRDADWEAATHGRFHTSWLASQMILDKPLVGHGPGTFPYLYFDYRIRFYSGQSKEIINPGEYSEYAHNEYLQGAAELGWPATLAAVAGLAALCGWAWRRLLRTTHDFSALLAEFRPQPKKEWKGQEVAASGEAEILQWLGCAWALLTLVCTLFNALGNFVLHTAHSVVLPLLAVAYLTALSSGSLAVPEFPARAARKAWLVLPLLVLTVAGGWLLAGVYRASCLEQTSYLLLKRWQDTSGPQKGSPPREVLDKLTLASSLDPTNFHASQMLGAWYLFNHQSDEALAALTLSLRYRQDPETYLNHGLALIGLNRNLEAKESFRKGLLYSPNHSGLNAAMRWVNGKG